MSRVGIVEVSNPQFEVLKAVKVFLKKRQSDPESELTELSEFMLQLREQKTPQTELLEIICDAATDLSSRQKENKDLSRRLCKSLEEMESNFKGKGWDEQGGMVHEAISAVIMNCNPPPKEKEVVNPVVGTEPSWPAGMLLLPPRKRSGCCVIS